MASTKTDLVRRQRRWADAHGVGYDARGFVRDLNDNLRQPLPGPLLAELARGSELDATASRPPRLHSLLSSAALVVNVFGYWRDRDATPLVRALGLGEDARDLLLRFEEPLPTGLAGDPPTADVTLHWPSGRLVSIESKFAEWLLRRPHHKRVFKDKYFPADGHVWAEAGLPRCQALADELQSGAERFRFLHAAQLLKHALGLAKSGAREWGLVYLYFEQPGREAPTHRAELERVVARLTAEVDLRVSTYQQLWAALAQTSNVAADYRHYLSQRYG